MAKTIDIRLRSVFDAAGAQAAAKALQGLAKSAAQANAAAAASQKLAKAETDAAAASERLSQAQQRTAAATANAATASQKLATEQARTAKEAANAAAAQTRAEAAAQRLAQAQERAAAAAAQGATETSRYTGLTNSFKGAMGSLAGEMGLAVGAAGGVALALGAAGAAMIDAASRTSTLQSALGEIDPSQLDAVSIAAANLATRFGDDVALQADAARVVMQAFGTDAAGAFDVLAAGYQNGLNVSGDFLDTLKEYGPQFAQLGFSAEQSLSLISAGLQNGARDTDFIGDAFKEFNILLREAGTAGTLAPLNAELAAVVTQFQSGAITGAEAFTAITDGLAAMDDPVAQRAAGVALFGTKFEDLGEQAILAMGQVDGALITTEGATAQLSTQFTSLSQVGPAAFAAIGQALLPVNDGLLAIANAAASGLGTLAGYGDQLAAVGENILQSSGSYEEYLAKVEELNGALPPFVAGLEPISEAAFAAAQGVAEAGGSVADFAAATADIDAAWTEALTQAGRAGPEAAAGLQSLGGAVYEVAGASEAGRASVEGLLFAFSSGTASAEGMGGALQVLRSNQDLLAGANATTANAIMQYAMAAASGQISAEAMDAAIQNLIAGQQMQEAATVNATAATDENSAATDNATGATDANTDSTDANAESALNQAAAQLQATAEADKLAIAQQELDIAAQQAASGSASIEDAAARLAAQFPITEANARSLISALRELQAAEARSKSFGGGAPGDVARSEAVARQTQTRVRAEQEAARAARGGSGGGGGGGGRPARAARGGGGGGRGNNDAAKRQKEAEAASQRLVEIEAEARQKIADINAQAAEKLVEIDRRAAEERARIAQQLADEIATSTANAAADAEVNDLDLVGATEEQMKALEARERAEADAAKRRAEANQKAQDEIAAGNAEAAAAEYEQQQQYIDERQQLDQAYYEKQAELAGNPEALAELDKQYQEAVAALEAARDAELAVEQAAIEAKNAQREAEKAQVIADAQEQKDAVVAAAMEQAERVKGASDAQKQAVADALAAQASAATDWASATEAAASRVASAYQKAADAAKNLPPPPSGGGGGDSGGGGGGATAAAGGGTFVTSGKTTLTVGDNPGGVEMVSVTPISGKGSTRVGGNMARMAGGGTLLAGLPSADEIRKAVQGLSGAGLDEGTADAVSNAADAIRGLIDLVADLQALGEMELSAGPIPLDALRDTLKQSNEALGLLRSELVPLSEEQADEIGRYLDAVGGALDLVSQSNDLIAQMNDLAAATAAPPPPLDPKLVARLAQETRVVADAFEGVIVPASEVSLAALERYGEAVAGAADILATMVDLARATAVIPPPINTLALEELARNSREVGRIIGGQLLDPTEKNVEMLDRYGQAVAGAVQILLDVANLRRELGAPSAPLNESYLTELAAQTRRVGAIVGAQMADPTEAGLATLTRYAEAVAASVTILTDLNSLRQTLGAPAPALNESYVIELAAQARAVNLIVGRNLVRFTDDTQALFEEYRDSVGASVTILADLATLRGDLANVSGPIDYDLIEQLAADARKVALAVSQNLFRFTEDTYAVMREFAEAVTNTVGVLRDTASLRREAEGATTPIPASLMIELADEAQRAAMIVRSRLVPMTEEQAADLERYASASASAIGILRDAAGLRADLAEVAPPLSVATMQALADDANRITRIVQARLVPTTEAQAAELERYAAAAQGAVGILSAAAGLRADAAQMGPAISIAALQGLADDANRITRIVQARLVPTTEEQAAELERYASVAGAAVDTLSGVTGLSATLFRDYVSPSDAQLDLLATDARRITDAFRRAAAITSTQGAEQAQALADAYGSTFTAVREGLLATQAINDTTFALDPRALATFEANTRSVIGTIDRVAALAAGVPSSNIAALQGIAGAVSGVADSYIKLAAVPFDDLSGLSGALGGLLGGGGGGGSTTVNVNVYGAPGMNVNQLANEVARVISASTNSRR